MTLDGRTFAVSIGGSPDLGKLGYPAREVERALLSVCGALVRAGACVAYGGDFRPNGFTQQMYRHISSAYADQSAQPFRHYVPEPILRRTAFEDLVASLRESQAVARARVFMGDQALPIRASGATLLVGEPTDRRAITTADEFQVWLAETAPTPAAQALSIMRSAQSRDTDGRVAMGGKMGIVGRADDQYEGAQPGLTEEALLTLEAGKPFIPLAAFGGATRDVAIALNLLESTARSPRGPQGPGYERAMAQIQELASTLPVDLREELSDLATQDRIETIAEQIVSLLERWPTRLAPTM